MFFVEKTSLNVNVKQILGQYILITFCFSGMGMMGQESQGLGGPGFTSGDLYPLPGRGGMQMAGDGGYPDAPGGQGDFKKK